jgi:sulfur-carrier protein
MLYRKAAAMVFVFTGLLLNSTGNQHEVSIDSPTLGDALGELAAKFPQTKRLLFDNTGNLRKAHRIVLNGQLDPHPSMTMRMTERDRVEFFTAIAGG